MQEQTWDDRLEDIVVHMQARQAQVKTIIQRYATGQASLNIALGTPGTPVLFPGAGFLTFIATVLSQGPALFQPMAEEIAQVYQTSPDNHLFVLFKEKEQAAALPLANRSLVQNFIHDLSRKLLNQVVKRLLMHYLPVLTVETTANWLPVPGSVISAATNATIMIQLTHWVGVMFAAYFENGQRWIGGSPAKTTALLRHYGDGDTSVEDIVFIPEVSEGIITRLLTHSQTIYEKAGRDTYNELRQVLANILRLKLLRSGFSFPQ